MQAQIKVIGGNGQISLGKEFAGRTVLVEQIEEGVWVIKSGTFIPDAEQWLHKERHLSKLERALDWADKHKPSDNFEAVVKKAQKKHG